MYKQIDFIKESNDYRLECEVRDLKDKFEKVRKGLYAKNSELFKLYLEQRMELDTLKSALCRCGLEVNIVDGELSFFSIKQKKVS